MTLRSACLGLLTLAATVSCGKDSNGVADVLLVASVDVSPTLGDIVLGGTAQLVATAKTASGIEVPGRAVTWSSSNEAIVSVSQSGVVSALAIGGPVHIKATVDGATGESLITVQPFPVNRVTVAPGNPSITVGQSTQLTATTLGANGEPLPGRLVSWQSSDPSVAAVTTTGMVLGISVGGPVTITATSEGKSGTAVVTVTKRPAVRLGFVQQPGSSVAGETITPAVRIAIQDDQGATVTDATTTVSISLGSNPGGSALTGTTSTAAVNGVATFANLSLNKAGAGYTLNAAASGLTPATSAAFNVVAAAANQLGFTAAPPGSARSGVPLNPQPVLQIRDHGGNAVGQAGVVVTASISSGTAILSGGTTATTNAAGTASFTTLTVNGVGGTVTLAFSAPGISAVTSGPITLNAGNPAALVVTTQPSGTAQSGVPFASQPDIALRDASGNPVSQAGVVVTASIASGPGGSLGGTTVVSTGADGLANFENLVITGPSGSYTLRFASTGLTGVTSNPVVVSAGAGATLALTVQPSSTAANGMAFPQQPVIQLRDAANNPVTQAGVLVTATIQSGGGTLGGTTSVSTNGSGTASFGNLAISGSVGSRTLLFAAAGYVTVTSSAINLIAGPAAQLGITTQPSSSATSGVPFATQPVLQLRDGSGNPVTQAGIVVTAAIASGGGTLGGTTTATTDDAGVASFSGLSISGASGNRTLGFSATGLTGATSATIAVSSATPSQLSISTQPSSAASSGVPLATQPAVQLRDALNLPVSKSGVVVTAAIASGGGTLGGTPTATTDASGIATFSNLSISGTPGNRTLSFSSPGLVGATSNTIAVAGAPASQVDLTTQPPATAQSGIVFTRAPVAQLEDAGGNAVSTAGVAVTVSVASGGATLGGTLTVQTDAQGKATFNGLTLSGPVGSHTLRFSAQGLAPVVSATIALSAGTAAKLAITTQPSASSKSNQAFAVQPVVQLQDAAGNPVATGAITITAAINSGIGTLGGDPTKATGSTGAAVFTDLKITGSGAYTLKFTATGLTQVVSASITINP